MSSGIVRAGGHAIEGRVLAAIEKASRQTGIDFGYLMAQAARESAFDSGARSGASSASGLYQFTQGTWLEMVQRHGARHGLADAAEQITRGPDGKLTILDPERRKEVLALRRDPEVAALMAAEYAKGNGAFLEKRLGRPATSTDLYLAHFLGPAGAARFLESHGDEATRDAADVLPEAARNNPSIFYDGRSARSVAGVYDRVHHTVAGPSAAYASLAAKTGNKGAAPPPAQAVATVAEPVEPRRPAMHG
ncbi:MAG: lytic transglycosylase domain-containing protein, partial [Alphaproteobacteria bacterium]|nr:lytic transglycosylase domain-containing protein [Alphaproteobacteria bacterium]